MFRNTFMNSLHVIDIRHADTFFALDMSEESVLRRKLLPVLLDIPFTLGNGNQYNYRSSCCRRISFSVLVHRCSLRRNRDRD